MRLPYDIVLSLFHVRSLTHSSHTELNLKIIYFTKNLHIPYSSENI